MSGKDRVLLQCAPHLVIDGALAVGDAIGAERVVFAIDQLDDRSADALGRALSERSRRASRGRPELVQVPPGYVSGQESALVNWVSGRGVKPSVVPPRVTDRGVDGRPTLVSNAETLAHAALIARHGARWFTQVGVSEDPGTALVTVGGAVAAPGVYEIELGVALVSLLRDAGGPSARIAGVLIGGYAGGWIGPEQVASSDWTASRPRKRGRGWVPGSWSSCPRAAVRSRRPHERRSGWRWSQPVSAVRACTALLRSAGRCRTCVPVSGGARRSPT